MIHKTPWGEYSDAKSKRRVFLFAARARAIAWNAKGREYLLRDLKCDDVEYNGGAWRVQNKFDYKIQMVRGEEFVLGDKIDRTEKNLFEFYRAYMVGCNCYGRYMLRKPEMVVAKYETDKQTFWAYGPTIEQARAFLGIRLYDEYRDLIHSVACKDKTHNK